MCMCALMAAPRNAVWCLLVNGTRDWWHWTFLCKYEFHGYALASCKNWLVITLIKLEVHGPG